jgi:hypothetical protein
MNHLPDHENTDAAACFLDGQAYRARIARIRALMEHALIARERVATSVHMRFRRDADVGIAYGFLLAYRPRPERCEGTNACTTSAKAYGMQAVLWLALVLLLGAIFVP